MIRIHGTSRTYDMDLLSSFEEIRSWDCTGIPVDDLYKTCTTQLRERYGYEIGILLDKRCIPLRSGEFFQLSMHSIPIVLIYKRFPRGVDNIILQYLTSFQDFLQAFTRVDMFDIFPSTTFHLRRYGKKVSKWELVKNTLSLHHAVINETRTHTRTPLACGLHMPHTLEH